MTHPTIGTSATIGSAPLGAVATLTLPPRPSLEHLKNEAKQRLEALRADNPGARLANAQFLLARDYGFASWRDLKADVEARASGAPAPDRSGDPVGDWIGMLTPNARIALHIRRGADGSLAGTMDLRDYGAFGYPLDGLTVEDARLSYTVLAPSQAGLYEGVYEARWDTGAKRWTGIWMAHGLRTELNFSRGTYPRAPKVDGLDGFWDGLLALKSGYRLSFRVRTDANGTYAWLDSPDGSGYGLPVRAIRRDGGHVTFAMREVTISGELSEDRRQIAARYVHGERATPLTLSRRRPGAGPPRSPIPPVFAIDPAVLASYAGIYAFPSGPTWEAVIEDGRLHALMPGGAKAELVPISATEFLWRDIEGGLTFEVAPDGRITAASRQGEREVRAARI